MIFYSDNFYYDDIYSADYNVYLVSQETGILNEYGISYNGEDDNEITLSFCYANEFDESKNWDNEVLESVLEWLITDEYKEFISEDNEDIIYLLKGVSYKKRFTFDMKGIIDVTFKMFTSYGYKKSIETMDSNTKNFEIFNPSNVNKEYKPVIEISNISSSKITITNNTTQKEPFIINNLNGENVYIDNMMGIISNSNNENLIMNSNRSWITLTKGINQISVDGDCDITFKSYYPIMV